MTSVLSLSPFTPFGGYDPETPTRHSLSSIGSVGSERTVRHCRPRHLSISSIISRRSLFAPSTRLIQDNVPSRSASVLCPPPNFCHNRHSISSVTSAPQSCFQTTFSEPALVPLCDDEAPLTSDNDSFVAGSDQNVELMHEKDSDSEGDIWHEPPELQSDIVSLSTHEESESDVQVHRHLQAQAFKRWVSTLRRRNAANNSPIRSPCLRRALHDATLGVTQVGHVEAASQHRRSGSHMSSIAFVTGVRSTSMTMTTLSLPSVGAALSAYSQRSPYRITSNPSSRTDLRRSMDSDAPSMAPALDEAAIKRSQRRARKIQELVRTESGYVSDLKCLQDAYFTLVQPLTSGTPSRHSSSQACVTDLVQLHEQVLSELQSLAQQLIPYEASRFSPKNVSRPRLYTTDGTRSPLGPDRRHHSRRERLSFEQCNTSDTESTDYLCTPQLGAKIAQVFTSKARRFMLYEEYGLRCDSMQTEADIHRSSAADLDYDRALETLQATLCPAKGKGRTLRRALGLKDLLIKPVQRITRYELLFRDLCTLTPCCDDPVSHSILDDALFVVSQTCHDLNEARGNPERLKLFDGQRTLQQRLLFDAKGLDGTLVQRFGRLLLCGSLFIAYRGMTTVKGHYTVCILFESCLVIAAAKGASKYHVLLVVPLARSTLEEPDNGKALQCHGTPHSWKLVFENEGCLFEVLCVACSAIEADSWRHYLSGRIAVETQHLNEGRTVPMEVPSPLTEEMRSVGKAYGRAISFNRRASVQRAATLGPTTELKQVIIKGTTAAGKNNEGSSTSLPIPRSQSVLMPSHIPILTPRRSERINLEATLADIWTRGSLPYPGLGSKRGEYSMRASANHVIRKLSIASITSNFSKRSMSYASIGHSSSSEDRSTRGRSKLPVGPKPPKKPIEPKVINFHTAPEAFLPEDFELKAPARARGRLAGLRTFTMGTERPRTPFFAIEDEKPAQELKRSKSATTHRSTANDPTSEPLTDRSQTSMSTPAILSAAATTTLADPRAAGELPPFGEKLGMRRRAKSRLARLLG